MQDPPPLGGAEPVVDTVLSSYRSIGCPEPVLCAFSGGADSTALLTALNEVRKAHSFHLTAVHVDHGLRPSAERDRLFCAALCSSLDIPLRVCTLHLKGRSEEEARNERYAALYREAERAGARVIALAHHAGDQAETVLMRLMRGTVSGIGGMAVLTARDGHAPAALWRPLLGVLPETLRGFLTARGQCWMEDETNGDRHYLRNMVRLDLLEPMQRRFPSSVLHIARSAEILGEESRYLDRCARQLLTGHARFSSPCACIDAGVLVSAPPVLRRRCVHLFLGRWGQCPMPGMEMILRLSGLSPGEACAIGNGCRAVRTEKYLHFLPGSAPRPVFAAPVSAPNPSGLSGDGIRCQAIPARLLPGAVLRPSGAGDRIVPFGMKNARPLREFLSARKTEPLFRPHFPVLCLGKEILWVPGVGPGEQVRIRPGEESLLLSYPGWLPGDPDDCPAQPQTNGGKKE